MISKVTSPATAHAREAAHQDAPRWHQPWSILADASEQTFSHDDGLSSAMVARLAALPADFRDSSADQAIRLANGRRILATATPHDLAFALAGSCGARGVEPGAVLPSAAEPDSDRMRGLVDRIFGEGPRTVVVLGPTR